MNKRSLEPIPSDDEMECSGLVPNTPPQPKKVHNSHILPL